MTGFGNKHVQLRATKKPSKFLFGSFGFFSSKKKDGAISDQIMVGRGEFLFSELLVEGNSNLAERVLSNGTTLNLAQIQRMKIVFR